MTTITKKQTWIEMGSAVRSEPEQGIYSAAFYLKEIARKGGVKKEDWEKFRSKTGLDNFYWRAYWARRDVIAAGGRGQLPSAVDAVVVFLHGWDGCADIWENLPARLLGTEKNLLVLSPDVNGFSRSPFRHPEDLSYGKCDPAANMQAVEEWLYLLRILGGRRYTPIIFVGHSMSGAGLFYFDEGRWENHKIGRVALAPALLMNDLLRKGFYRALGLSIFASQKLQLEQVSNSISPVVVNQLISGASKAVQAIHEKVFKSTNKNTLSSTFYAMGRAELPARSKQWPHFKVLLGHEDRLVGLTPMLNLLVEMGINSRQVNVLLGDHYFFSVGRHSYDLHQEGREITMEEIIQMVRACRR